MKQLLPKFWAKFVATVLLVGMTFLLVVSAVGVAVCAVTETYLDNGAQLRKTVLDALVAGRRFEVGEYYERYRQMDGSEADSELQYLAERFSPEQTNYFFTVTDQDGNVLLDSYTDDYQFSSVEPYSFRENAALQTESKKFYSAAERQFYLEQFEQNHVIYSDHQYEGVGSDGGIIYYLELEYGSDDLENVTITHYVRSELSAKDDIYYAMLWTNRLVQMQYALIGIGAASLLLSIVLLVFLLCSAGRREGEEEIHRSWIDRIPLDLLLVILGCIVFATVAIGGACANSFGSMAVFFCAATPVWTLLLLLFLMSFAVRVKTGTLWNNNIIYWVLMKIKRFFLWLWHGLCYAARSLPLYWKVGVFWAALSLLEMVFVLVSGSGETLMFWFFEKLVLTAVLILIVISMRRLQEGAKRIAAGEVDYTIDLTHMIGDFKAHGEDLNSIRDGLQAAVDERVKSERMKAELITNVSHDIKTPLTSIVNYVDLLKKEELGSDTAREYVAVLERQAQRLKKLTEDLVEASKASTGNIPVNLERTDLNVLLSQAAGEFTDRFAEQKLELRISASQEQTCVMADGRLLWRVFSNLMSNVGKYALEGTRVYLSIDVQRGRGVISLKNISRYPLNVSGEELMERFVRGDKSRSTEGSGLGLSIARSLTELQGGVFDITVDGDLFKATISFALV